MRHFISSLTLVTLCLGAGAQVPSGEGRNWAVVDFSVNFMREAPDYTAELGDQSLMGTVVEVVGEDSYWRRIVSPEPYTAWVNEMGLAPMSEDEVNAYIASPKYICTADYTYVYSQPSAASDRVSDLVLGCLVRPVLDSRGRAVRKGRFLACELPSGLSGWVPKGDVEPFGAWTASRQPGGANIVSAARRFLGVPYLWGGTSIKGVDCSGFTLCVYFQNGILLPRNTSQQVRAGVPVALDSLEPGDLVFFGRPAEGDSPARVNHVAIYIGGGRIIHSSQKVRISSLNPADEDYYDREPLQARRILGHVGENGVSYLADSPLYFLQPSSR